MEVCGIFWTHKIKAQNIRGKLGANFVRYFVALKNLSCQNWLCRRASFQEDVNGEKLTVKQWWIFGADFFTVCADFSWFVRDINGEKKNRLIDDLFHG